MLLAFITVHLYRKSRMSLEKQCGTHTEYEHRKIQYFQTEYQTTSITFQSNMTLKTVVGGIPLVYVKKKKVMGSGGEMDRKRGECNAPR